MINNSQKNFQDSFSSEYYDDACSNSEELNNLEKERVQNENSKNKKEQDQSCISIKQDSKSDYKSPPKKSKSINNYNNNTNNSTGICTSSNRPSNINRNIKLSSKDLPKSETQKSVRNKNMKKINIYTMNSVKKNILSPIDENTNNYNSESSKKKLNSITKDNINENININIIINKKNKQKIENKFVFNNTNINNINSNLHNKNSNKSNIEIINTDINKKSENTSIYSSVDELSEYSIFKKLNKIKEIENDDESENEKKNMSSFLESNSVKNQNFGSSISESIINNKNNYKNYQSSKDNLLFFQNHLSLMINSIIFEDIEEDHLTVNDLKVKYNLREIPVKRKEISEKNKYLKTLIELQIFNFGVSPIWCMKISKNGKYLAAGNKEGIIRIYEIMGYDYDKYQKDYNSKNITSFLNFVCEKPLKELNGHKKDIIDLSWSSFKKDLLLSASVDHFVFLWDISRVNNSLIKKFEHNDVVTSVQFSPTNENIFVSGCFDKYVRIYNIKKYINQNDSNYSIENKKEENKNNFKKKKSKESFLSEDIKDFFNIAEIITSISHFPEGDKIAVGTKNGKVYIYDNLIYSNSFNARNRYGKNSLGKKVTSIVFINKSNALVTTCDSCIRLVSMNDGKYISKYKGYTNEQYMIRADVDLSSDIIISGSEDGFCYVWHIKNEEKKKKNYNYEYFKPFLKDVVECSIIIDEKCFVNYIKKILRLTNKINVVSVIINSTEKGKIEVLLNIDEETN